jgi:Asparagine synthase (glutamine-hydrolyzing)
MCGIVGILKLDRSPVSKNELVKMYSAIKHRGPDGEGYFIDKYLGLGHVRLAILDPSERGSQPMSSKNGEWTIVFNGCIYNFKELRETLRSFGHTFISETDTEVIVEGLAEWGLDIFPKLNGMFAIAAWHKSSETLWLARDRFGIKPLYYCFTNQNFLFASEIKAILAHNSSIWVLIFML